jgi:transcriptional regulator GlxA family with amidase domain
MRRIVLVAFDGVEALDVTGPASVFSRAQRTEPGAYELVLASARGGAVRTEAGLVLGETVALHSLEGPIDTLLVAGGGEAALQRAHDEDRVSDTIRRLSARTRRVGSICTGAFILGGAGLLDGRRVATHWGACARLQEMFPKARVEPDSIYCLDGPVCTSAGVTAGIDLALAIVEADLGRTIASAIARDMVLYLRRSGGQSQYSAPLQAQARAGPDLQELVTWISANPGADLSAGALAERAGLSERTFLRRFSQTLGCTPARYVRNLRLERARSLLEETDLPLERVAQWSGFGSLDALQRVFRSELKTTPGEFRDRFGALSAMTLPQDQPPWP